MTPQQLAKARILVTNDDGIHAPGLKACEEIARALSDEVWVVAPEYDQSGVSHSLSLNDPLRLREVGPRHFAVQPRPRGVRPGVDHGLVQGHEVQHAPAAGRILADVIAGKDPKFDLSSFSLDRFATQATSGERNIV